MLMQEPSRRGVNAAFPRHYLQRLEEYRKRQTEIRSQPRPPKKPALEPRVFSNRCKQAISMAGKVYCCALKELVDASLCRACPSFEREPLEYTLFRRE